jgi:hypothetical protein
VVGHGASGRDGVLAGVESLPGAVLGVVGGCGGIGASRFAAVLAATAASVFGRSLLIDLDSAAGGIDVLIGLESTPGPRWSSLRVDGGFLDPNLLLAGLPPWGRVAVLACDQPVLAADVVAQVLDAARLAGPVVLDLPRYRTAARDAALARCSFVGLVTAADVAALTAARRVLEDLVGAPVALIVRGPRRTSAGQLIGAPVAGRLPPAGGRDSRPLHHQHLPRAMRLVARGVLDALREPAASGPPALAPVPTGSPPAQW